ncbi:MAG TPA: hypothetical protein VLI65_01550, partial [Pyrinomonadaceae bacterium]|nr:hypothetical protein [Pyrinomonadaceae bacterium]
LYGWLDGPSGRTPPLAFEGLWLFAGARTRVMAESTHRIYSAYSRAGFRTLSRSALIRAVLGPASRS